MDNQFSADILGNKVSVAVGDITRSEANALVVPQFTFKASYGGVGGAVARSGADAGMQMYEDFAKRNGRDVPYATVFVSNSGGGLSAKLIHVTSVGSGEENEFSVVRQCMYNALKAADASGISSIAVPALGTGIIGDLTNKQSAEAMMSAIHQYKQEGGRDIHVQFVIFGSPQAAKDFADVLQTKSYETVNPNQKGEKEFSIGAWFIMQDIDADLNREYFKVKKDEDGFKTGIVNDIPVAGKIKLQPPKR